MRNTKALFCAIALTAAPAWAYETGHWYLAPQVGGIWTDADRALEDEDWLYGLTLGRHLSDRWSAELNVNTAGLDGLGGGDVDLHAGSLDVLRVFARDSAISPYVTLGAGALRSDPSQAPTSTDFMMQAGVGLLLRLGANERGTGTFSLRPEIKARWDDAGSAGYFRDYIGTLGFQISFGSGPVRSEPQRAPEPAPAPPLPMPEQAPPPPTDSDGDGVMDPDDRCAGTPGGVAVDARGCPQQSAITLEGVTFEVNSAELTAESRPALARVAGNLTKHADLRIEIQGHTDSSGSDSYNLQLSQRRADSVRDYLLRQGVAARQVEARGYGESRPIADNATAEGRARNRRVAMSVIENPSGVVIESGGQR